MATGISESAVSQLLDMGFGLDRVKIALSANNNDVNEAMEWLLCHVDEDIEGAAATAQSIGQSEPAAENMEVPSPDVVADVPQREDAGRDGGVQPEGGGSSAGADPPVDQANKEGDAGVQDVDMEEDGDKGEGSGGEGSSVPKALKCDECGKLFATADEANFHAVKTQHASFSETTEEKRALSAEEKREQMMKLQEKLKQRRLEREEAEKAEALNREKNRIKIGKEIAEARRKQEEAEMKKIIEERKREKMEEKLARQRVLDNIARDKAAREAKQKGTGEVAQASPQPAVQPAPIAQAAGSAEKKNYDKTKLQLRLPSGRVLTEVFGAKEPLAAVRLFVASQDNILDNTGNITFMTSFPKKVFSIDDWEKPLDALDLVPSAVLIVKYN